MATDNWWDRAADTLTSRPARVAQVIAAAASLLLVAFVAVQQVSTRDCLASFSAANARATAARAEAATEDRKADEADRAAEDDERHSFLRLLVAIQSGDKKQQLPAFLDLTVTYQRGDVSRAATAKTRAENERKRADNPVPDPSLRCD
jgi:hypothetical protein